MCSPLEYIANQSPLYSVIYLPLNYYLYSSFVVLSCTFVAQKYQNARHTEKAVRRLFAYKSHATFLGRAAGAKAHSFGELKFPSSQTLLARNGAITASPSVAGCCGPLISAAILKIIYTRANLQTCLAQWPAKDGAYIVLFNGAGFIGISITNHRLYAASNSSSVP